MESNLELKDKLTISVEEASLISGIGTNTIYRMMKNPRYDFVLWIGKKRRIKREAFEDLRKGRHPFSLEKDIPIMVY